MRGIEKIDPDGFVNDYKRQAMWTARLVKSFDDSDLTLRPGDGSMSTAEQIQHILSGANLIRSVFSDEVPTSDAFKRQFNVATIKDSLSAIKQMIGEVTQAALQASPEFWLGEIAPFGPDWRMNRGQVAYLMIDHEAHHRGQLTVYLRVAGKTPPVIYAPVNENEIFEGI